MARRYEIDELLWLRDSPLVAKPPGLPPLEEWMPQPDPTTTQRKTHTTRDTNNPSETNTNRRPSFFEPKHISRNSNSEDIVLGPPKTAFASSRIGGKGSFDLTDRPARTNDSDDAKNDRFNFRDKFFKDRDAQDNESERRDAKPGPLASRRGEREDWSAGRPRRTFGPEEQERKPRRNGEFDRWENKEGPRDPNADRAIRDKDGRFPIRKEGQPPRSKYEGSWFRDEHAAREGAEADEDKPPLRNREWRQNQTRSGPEREWNRGAKFEQEPEWLDANERDEPRRAHTQEDFQRWKERMKAGSGSSAQAPAHAEEKKEAPAEAPKPEVRRTDGEIFSNSAAQFISDNSMERFFGLLGDPKAPTQSPEASTPVAAELTAKKDPFPIPGKPGKSSRFAGLFSPMPESPAREPESMHLFNAMVQQQQQQQPPAPEGMPFPSRNADQAGFQRIMEMLGGQRSQNSTPQEAGLPQQQRSSSVLHAEQQNAAQSLPSPSRELSGRADYMGPAPESPMSASARPPGGNPSPHSSGIAPPPGLMPEGMPRPPPGLSGQKTPAFLDDPAIANMQRPDSEQLRRRPANGPPMGYFDDMPFPQGNQGPMTPGGPITPGGSRAQGPNQPPMPLHRPPGLEHLPPPGWTGQPVPQQGNVPSPMGPPPGIPAPGRGMNPNFPPRHASYARDCASNERAPGLPSGSASGHDATSWIYDWPSSRIPSYAAESRSDATTWPRCPGTFRTRQPWPTGPSLFVSPPSGDVRSARRR
ncbi:uncharacterized protein N7515_009302 [Penicillium bovifimosum]|uniref:Uncharacterized protein n=1 Tax=Penicillium bovifimosum TaxID=126998 RepID=A0A9W9KUD7_9EURO|nr:uncharacterized protein N7515_009302 [Penicillium bovifimosum]KAJ5121341.1 hypothetical protein N7515_009302 [Penicillium bovifimosum]